MEYDMLKTTLFEVSWEVCNKVGGIYAVVSSKALTAVKQFGDSYYTVGPDLGHNPGFVETKEPGFDGLKEAVAQQGLSCRFGRWSIPGNPKAILVGFRDRYDQNELLHGLWQDYGVNSLNSEWEYIEPVMFSTACGEVIATLAQHLIGPLDGPVIAHFHEWMCGAGILKLKKIAPAISTVFTTHATMLGRSLAGSDVNIYQEMKRIDPVRAAAEHNITAKCSMERASAREADCFTTVSRITAEEASFFLSRTPDIVTPNGLDNSVIHDYSGDRGMPLDRRARIFGAASRLLRRDIPDNTRVVMISGRYEFHNKGINVFLEALAGVNEALKGSDTRVLALCLAMGGHRGVNQDAIGGDPLKKPPQWDNWICSHTLSDPENDPIIHYCRRLGLDNRPENNAQFIFVPALLDGNDGFFNMTYDEVLSACELGVFPSWYEPWGYTPQESAANAVPTITTDLSGFGMWVEDLEWHTRQKTGVTVLPRRNSTYEDTVYALRDSMLSYLHYPEEDLDQRRRSARELSAECSWEHFFHYYIQAYTKAMDKASERGSIRLVPRKTPLTRILGTNSSTAPNLHSFTVTASLPTAVERLPEMARNLWWSQHPRCWELFASLNPKVWTATGHNPIVTMEKALPSRLVSLVADEAYMRLYKKTVEDFDAYMSEPVKEFGALSAKRPLAYFSTEYGLHECLPIYSGGLGVLSGDHLKSASDLNIPLVAIGLIYKNGYFRQQIDRDGRQKALYPENDFTKMPVHPVTDKKGKPLTVTVDLPGRTLHARVWRVQVGRIPLYLMDTDVEQNNPDDRRVTARLYESDRDFRLRQEILLGIGGVRLLQALGITPGAYHMNEGHSAFLIFERLRQAMEKGLSLEEAAELVRGSNVFTTHTPVDAGNERFPAELMKPYLEDYARKLGVSWQDVIRMGNFKDAENTFEMTALALNYSLKSNGVSALHGVVSRHMWQEGWRGVPVDEIPIGHVTNGIHVPSYAGRTLRLVLNHHLGAGWMQKRPDDPVWEKIAEIPDRELIDAKAVQKNILFDKIRQGLPEFFRKYRIPYDQQKMVREQLNASHLVIGFARRFAPYKRAMLLFSDPDRLERILNNAGQPVIFIYAGKAHPADAHGADILQSVIHRMLEPRFLGRIFFMEDYSLSVSRLMVQGCDVWLNTPRAPFEACGTSGQKIAVNGGLNLSISDGWWSEGYDGNNGWTIGNVNVDLSRCMEVGDEEDAAELYELLENSVIPLYYARNEEGVPDRWMEKVKNAMRTLIPRFSSARMVNDYTRGYYVPAAERMRWLSAENNKEAARIAAWKKDVASRFGSLKMEQILIEGVENEEVEDERTINICASLDLGEMQDEELLVQFVVGPGDGKAYVGRPDVVVLRKNGEEDGFAQYTGTYTPTHDGTHMYGVRVLPTTPGLASLFETRLVLWG